VQHMAGVHIFLAGLIKAKDDFYLATSAEPRASVFCKNVFLGVKPFL
jgi:hypothetical protein